MEMMFTAQENNFVFLLVISHTNGTTAVLLFFGDCLVGQVVKHFLILHAIETFSSSIELIVNLLEYFFVHA